MFSKNYKEVKTSISALFVFSMIFSFALPFETAFASVPINTPPTITLIGANPFNLTVNTPFVDPGATATDTEDGDLTSSIVRTGTVNASTIGTYILTYVVKDSGNLYATTTRTVNVVSAVNTYCQNGGDLTYEKFVEAKNAGLISFGIVTNTSTNLATVNLSNQTGCSIPMSLSVYKMFVNQGESNWLSTQQLFDNSGIINATSSTFYEVNLPSCMAQIDFWYGLAPTNLLDSNPYGGPTSPVVVDWKFVNDNLCSNIPTNTPPTITLTGANPFNLTVNTPFVDPGATATDTEDGDLTSAIVRTGTANASSTGTYILTYVVKDSGNLYATTTRTVVVSNPSDNSCVVPAPTPIKQCDGSFPITLLPSTEFSCGGLTFKNFRSVIKGESDTPASVFLVTANEDNGKIYLNAQPSFYIPAGEASKTLILDFDVLGSTSKIGFSDGGANTQSDIKVCSNTDFPNSSNCASGETAKADFSVQSGNSSGFLDISGAPISSYKVILGMEPVIAQAIVHNTSISFAFQKPICPVPPTNTPPTITLTGDNPFNLTVDTPFVDPGATATDTEDGDLTSQIVKTGTVNASSTGTYILTYVVKDSGNLYATTTRTVNVNPVVCTSNCGGGSNSPTVSLSANPGSILAGATSTLSWTSTNTNSCLAVWTTATSTSGSQDVAPSVTTEYSISCTGTNGTASATTTVTITTTPVTPPTGGGGSSTSGGSSGGGGGNIGGHRRDISNLLATGGGEILGATSCMYLRDHLKIDWQNDPIEVLKLQSFLNVFEKESLSLTGIFDQTTFEAVERFQIKYSSDILEPWGDKVTTGFVYILTKKKVNEIYCNSPFPVTQIEQDEIDAFRSSYPYSYYGGDNSDTTVSSNTGSQVGSNVSNNVLDDSSSVVELKDSSTTQSVIRNVAISLFALPQKIFGNWKYFLVFLLLLIILITIIKSLFGSGGDTEESVPATPVVEKTPTKESIVNKSSPVIILPGANKEKTTEILPDEEIVIENPEEGPEEIN